MLPRICSLAAVSFLLVSLPARSADTQTVLTEANKLASLRQYVDAEALYARAAREALGDARPRHMLGRILARQGKYPEALAKYKEALKLTPGDASLLSDVGITLSINGDLPLGARFLYESIKASPRYSFAYVNLAVTLEKLKAFAQCKEFLLRALALQPSNGRLKESISRVEKSVDQSVPFDFAPAPTYKDIEPGNSRRVTAPSSTGSVPGETPTGQGTAGTANAPKTSAAEDWLESKGCLFYLLKGRGFSAVKVSGTGIVQCGKQSEIADNFKEIKLDKDSVQVSEDVALSLEGPGELIFGSTSITALDDNCSASVNLKLGEITCLQGRFSISDAEAVIATPAGERVRVQAIDCREVYGQDNSRIIAEKCDQVTLVGVAQGTMEQCTLVTLNDDARAVVEGCKKLVLLSRAAARVKNCVEVEKSTESVVEELP